MSDWRHHRGGHGGGFCVGSLVLIAALATGCASASLAPETAATGPDGVYSFDSLDELREDAERHFMAGEQAYLNGRYSFADQQFQRALDVYLDGYVAPDDRKGLQAAFNDLFNRIHAMSIEEMVPTSGNLVSLVDEPLPSPSAEDLEELRARLEVAPDELPRFSMPVPSPLDNERVFWAIDHLTRERKEIIEEGLSRATRYLPMIEAILEEVGVPTELAWVPLIESLFKTGAYSRAAAVGMWQFMRGTARLYGMTVSTNLDERMDPVKATRTAAIYMKDLYAEFGDWDVVLAAYNAGKGRVSGAMERAGTRDFWRVAQTRFLPRETRDHVPKIYAAIWIGNNPELYGLQVVHQEPYVYDESVMDVNTDLRVVADAAGVPYEAIRELNPHLKAWVPRGYPVRIPLGTKPAFETALAAIPPDERLDFLEHRVARDDTLSEIAGRYGTRVSEIVDVNKLRSANRLSIGQRLIIPVGPTARAYRPPAVTGFDTGERTTVRVQRGDSLYEIAGAYNTTVSNLMRWNDLTSSRIYPGDTLIVYYGVRGNMATPTAVSRTRTAATDGSNGGDTDRQVYTVRRGDSLSEIALRFSVSVDDLKRWNSRRGNTIHPGDKLVVYGTVTVFDDGGAGINANTTTRRYVVRRGDSPYEIALRFGVGLDALLAANGLSQRSTIHPGEELLIPGGGSSVRSTTAYTVRRGDTLSDIAERHSVSLRSLLQANGLSSRTVIRPGDQLTIPQR